MKVQMTQGQLDHIHDLIQDYDFYTVTQGDWDSPENEFLNSMTDVEKATAYIASEKVEIIEPEISGREAMNALFDGEEIMYKGKKDNRWHKIDFHSLVEDFKNKNFMWRKAKS